MIPENVLMNEVLPLTRKIDEFLVQEGIKLNIGLAALCMTLSIKLDELTEPSFLTILLDKQLAYLLEKESDIQTLESN